MLMHPRTPTTSWAVLVTVWQQIQASHPSLLADTVLQIWSQKYPVLGSSVQETQEPHWSGSNKNDRWLEHVVYKETERTWLKALRKEGREEIP